MMKRIHMAMALLVAVLSACSNNETIPQEAESEKGSPMVITTNLERLTASRAGITNDNLTGHTFLFSSKPENEPDGSSYIYEDLLATYIAGKWSFTKEGESITPVWKDKTTKIEVTALRAATPTNDVYSLAEPNETTDIQANDWLYFSGTINPTLSIDTNNELALVNGAIPINFKHINSKIDISLSFKEGLPELEITSVVIGGTKTSAKFDNDSFTVTEVSETTDVSAYEVTEENHGYEVILLPQTATLEVTVTATDNNNNTHVFNWTSSSVTLESGNKYTLTLELDYSQVNGLMASRGAWTSETTQSLNAN